MSAPPRPTPFDLAFAELADERFPAIREGLAAAGTNPGNRDEFLLNRDVVTLVRELRPDEGVGEEIGQLAALVHHAYRFWAAGRHVVQLDKSQLDALLAEAGTTDDSATGPPAYVQVPERRIWAETVPGGPHEPLDGCFIHVGPGGQLEALGVFGLHPDRPGFTVVEAAGTRAPDLARPDGSALFAPLLAGGAAAGLRSLAGGEELLELGYRMRRTVEETTSPKSS